MPSPASSLEQGTVHGRRSGRPRVGVLIVNWRGLRDTMECCESLRQVTYPSMRVYVADNASRDGSVEALRAEFPSFAVIENQDNLGFSSATNQLITQALGDGCDYVLLLNNDTVVDPDFLQPMVDAAEADPTIGLVSCKIYFGHRAEVIWFAGGAIDRNLSYPFRHIGENAHDSKLYDHSSETEWASGCCLLVRAALLPKVGLLDERFGYYYEDVDWCLRAREAGWKVWYEARGKVWHKVGQSTSRRSLAVEYYGRRNVLLVLRRILHGSARYRYFLHAALEALRHPVNDPAKAAICEGVFHGLLGRGGTSETIGVTWWSNALVKAEKKSRRLVRQLLRRRSASQVRSDSAGFDSKVQF